MIAFLRNTRPKKLRGEAGATSVEYGLMVALIAIVIVGGVTVFGVAVTDLFSIPAGVFAGP